MKNEISTHLFKIDFKFIKDNYLNRSLWGKTWLIYKFGKLSVELKLCEIDVENNKARLGLNIVYLGDNRHHYGRQVVNYDGHTMGIEIPLDHPEFTDVIFQNQIYYAVVNALVVIEKCLVENFAVYRQERIRLNEWLKMLEDKANSFLDENNVSNEDIRDAYVSAFVSENYTNKSLYDIKERYINRLLTREFICFASYNGKQEEVEKYSKIAKKGKVSKSTISVWLKQQKAEQELAEIECPSI